jgi:lipopolysaccharide transport system permease protein
MKPSTLLSSRQLIRELVGRDVRTRYLGSLLGLFWSVLNPLAQLLLYTVVFSLFLGLKFGVEDTTGTFAEYLFCALLPWSALQESTVRSARGFLDQSNLIRKMRLPLEVIPFSTVCSALIHQCLASLVFFLVLIFRGSLEWTTLPLILPLWAVQGVLMYGIAMAIATLNVFFRDIAQIIGVVFMFLFWLTPIVYPRDLVPAAYLPLLDLNPLTHMVGAYRYAVFGAGALSWGGIAYWCAVSLLALWVGHRLLRRSQAVLVDLV